MGKTADKIESHIERTREDLGSNLHALENKVKSATDWKHHFKNNPMTMLGVAFGGGVFLATMLGNGRRRSYYPRQDSVSHVPHAATNRKKRQALETWDNIKRALIGVAASRFKDFVGEVVPGFNEQFRSVEDKRRLNQPGEGSV